MRLVSKAILALLMGFIGGVFMGILNSCTYSINLIHSEGTASDLIDENQKADADMKPNINLSTLR